MFGLGFSEILIIAVAAAILLFGSKKIVELARSMGRVSGEFKKGKQEVERELKASEEASAAQGGQIDATVPAALQGEQKM